VARLTFEVGCVITTRACCAAALALAGIVCASRVMAAGAGAEGPGEATGIAQVGANQALPGGASSLQEAHGDWRVACASQNGPTRCTLSQQLMDAESRQRILAIELTVPAPNRAEGTLVLPFGLALDKGIVLKVDDAASPTLRFRTCLPAGCIVTVIFDEKAIAALRSATTLTVAAVGDDTQEVSFGVSLKGFASAFDRTATLARELPAVSPPRTP
jgi:invasion protein IalB